MRPTGSAALATLLAAVVVVLLGGRIALAAPVAVCTVNDIIAAQAGSACPASNTDPCSLTLEYEAVSGCDFLFGDRDVVVSSQSSLRIDSGTVMVSARSFTVAPGGLVDGSGSFGGSFTVTTTENIHVVRNGGMGRVVLAGESQGGSVLFQAGGDIVIDGVVRVDNSAVDGSGGDITFRAVGDIVTGGSSSIDPKGGGQGCGGTVDFAAGGRIEIGNTIDASGGDGGSIDLTAGGDVILRDRLHASGIGDAGGGGCVSISAAADAEINGPIESRGATGPEDGGCGGAVSIESLGGDVVVRDKISVSSGGPDGGAGSIEIFTLAFAAGSIDVTSAGSLEAEGNGSDSCGGFVSLDANLDIMVDGVVLAGGGDSGGDIDIDAGSSAFVRERIEVHGRSAGGSAGEVAVDAGTLRAGNVVITDKIDASGGICDGDGVCGDGGTVDVSGCSVTLAASGSIGLRGPGATGLGGDVFLSARRQLTVQGSIDTTGLLSDGETTLVHPSLTPPVVTPGVVTPPPQTPIACSGSCPQLAPPCSGYCRHLCDCGDGTIDQFEQCDGAAGCDAAGEVCGVPGALDACICIITCGDGTIDPGEECDSGDLGGATCESLGFPGGGLTCTPACTIDHSACIPVACGDGDVSDDEVCESGDLGGESCQSLGFVGGELLCGFDCRSFDDGGCDEGFCGDGIRCFGGGCMTGPGGGPEECDDGDAANDNACLDDCDRATCGDEVVCADPEDCTTGPDGGVEECDEGADNADDAACRVGCRAAKCGDGVVCSDVSCESGPEGGPEECDGEIVCCRDGCQLRDCPDGLPCAGPSGCCHPDSGCDDDNPCTEDTCDLFLGCSHGSIAGCCLIDDECDDGNPCTDDVCDPSTHRCVSATNTASCDDGNGCTRTDTCAAGTCLGMDPVICTARDACHEPGVCEPASGACSDPPKPDGSACLDGDLCNGSERCQGGVCEAGAALDCDDDDVCTTDRCHASGGCMHGPVTGCCLGDAQCDDGNPCTDGQCSRNRCQIVPNTAPCDDGDACTRRDVCAASTCVGTDPVVCAAPDQCHVAGVCDPATGVCADAFAVNGTSCDDGDPCSEPDTCQAGRCAGTVSGLGGFGCTLERLAVPEPCVEPLPRTVRRAFDRELRKARKARSRAEQLIEKSGRKRQIDRQLRKMEKALAAIDKAVTRAERKKSKKRSVSPECAETIRALVAEPLIVLAELQR